MRSDDRNLDWPQRPWIMAGLGAASGFAFWRIVGVSGPPVANQSIGTFVAVATLAFFITAERLRWWWAAVFSVGCGAILALVGWTTASYNRPAELLEWPFLAAILAVLVAAPLFQTIRDEGRLALPYPPIHRYAWTDAIIGAASLAFTGLSFLLLLLFSALFQAIGIGLLHRLLNHGGFNFAVGGMAFGAISAVLRERDGLLDTLHRLVRLVVAVLAPVLAAALGIFLLALPLTGFAGLWRSGLPETPLLLSAAAFAFAVLNAILGDSPEDRRPGALWRASEYGLAGSILPLGILAVVSMMMRVTQYGWTPERIWGVIAALVATAYGLAAWLAIARGRRDFDRPLRDYQKALAVGLCGLALFLALPIIDFGALSARSQVARMTAGRVSAEDFDWTAMATAFGPAGRRRLGAIAAGKGALAKLAAAALEARNRYDVDNAVQSAAAEATIERKVRLLPDGVRMTPQLRKMLADNFGCRQEKAVCVVYQLDSTHLILAQQSAPGLVILAEQYDLGDQGWRPRIETAPQSTVPDLRGAAVAVEPVTRRQLVVDGVAVGPPLR